MALRMARQRSIHDLTTVFEQIELHEMGYRKYVERMPRQHWLCPGCRRTLFTQEIRGKKIPFFQRSITSTTPPRQSSGAPFPSLNESTAISQSIPLPADPLPSQSSTSTEITRRRSKTKSATLWTYCELAKPRLAVLIALSTMSAYAIAPYPASLPTLLFLSSGTLLCIASANTFNMLYEPEFDAMMSRTRNRPLVRKALTPTQAKTFGIGTGIAGLTILSAGVNPTVALLGAGNIILYSGIYTPLKRKTILNTWVGAVVGGIPPLMGWAACSPEASLLSHPGGLLLAGILYAWQFPHFNALAYTMRHDYASAGYCMMCVVNPGMNTRVALRYSIAMMPLCWGLVACGLVDPWYLVDSTIVNAWVIWKAFQFWKYEGEKGSARGLFFAGLIQLPAVLILAMLHKDGLWDWLWGSEDQMENSQLEDGETSMSVTAKM